MELIRDYNLLDTANFQQVDALRPIIENSTDEELQALSQQLAPALNAGLLSEARTTTYRDGDVMLSSVQGWRAGERSEQTHVWQATLDADAQVFTTHPSEPIPTGTTDWYRDTGYWTGSGSLPWTVQHDRVSISIYDPQYAPDLFSYEPYTHAYFPTDHFDEVVQRNGWTFGRLGDGYVALWSSRPAEFVDHDPATTPTNGMTGPFDLVASGGPDDVWITEVGSASEDGTFHSFVDAIAVSARKRHPRGEGLRGLLPFADSRPALDRLEEAAHHRLGNGSKGASRGQRPQVVEPVDHRPLGRHVRGGRGRWCPPRPRLQLFATPSDRHEGSAGSQPVLHRHDRTGADHHDRTGPACHRTGARTTRHGSGPSRGRPRNAVLHGLSSWRSVSTRPSSSVKPITEPTGHTLTTKRRHRSAHANHHSGTHRQAGWDWPLGFSCWWSSVAERRRRLRHQRRPRQWPPE